MQIDRLGTWLARFSYSLYLIHIPVLALLAIAFPDDRATIPLPLRYALHAIGTLIAAYGFYWLFERHTDSMRQWLKTIAGSSLSTTGGKVAPSISNADSNDPR